MLSLSLAVLLATAERLHVEWVAPEGCPSRDALAASLESSVPPNRTFHASVRIDEPREEEAPWRAVVITTADGNQHTRVVQGPDCERVTDAAVLVVTLAATSLPPVKEDDVDAAPPIAAPVVPSTEVGGETSDRVAPTEPFTFRLRVQPLVGAHAGVFPFPGLSWGIGIALVTGRLRAQLAVTDWVSIQGSAGRGVRGGLLSGTLRGCWLFEPHPVVRLGPCAAFEAGRLVMQASGVAAPETGSVFWSSVAAGVTAGFQVSKSISPWVTAEAGVNLVRPRFILSTREEDVTLHAVGWVVGRLTVGVEFELPVP